MINLNLKIDQVNNYLGSPLAGKHTEAATAVSHTCEAVVAIIPENRFAAVKPFIGAIGRTARLLAIGLGAAIEASTVFQPEEKVVLSYQPEPAAIPEFSMPTEDAAVLYCAYAGQPSPFTIE